MLELFYAVFGLYEKIIESILHFFKDIKNNTKFLLPLSLGTFTGVFIVGNILKFLFVNFRNITSFAFIGLILGSIKLIVKEANVKQFSLLHILCFLVTFSFSIFLVFIEKYSDFFNFSYIDIKYLILCGILMSAGIVIPGLSKTVILMLLGIYELYLNAILTMNINFLLPIGIGVAIGSMIFLIIFNLLFKYLKSYTYFAIIGFILGSVFIIYPGFVFNYEGFFSIFILITSFIITLKLTK